jgi:hypothetical protein
LGIHEEVNEILAQLPDAADFGRELKEDPEPSLEQVPDHQRVRQYLAHICGALWECADVASCPSRNNSTTYVAIAPFNGRAVILFVLEDASGELIVASYPA